MLQESILLTQLRHLLNKEDWLISNLSNAAAAIYEQMSGINWAGFYILKGSSLWLGPFAGKPACVRIPVGKGVCGTAAAQQCTQVVEDVHQFPGHIACDNASNSEIVVPIFYDGKVVAVLDIDSPLYNRFGIREKEEMEAVAALVETVWQPMW